MTYETKQIIDFKKPANIKVVSFVCDKKLILVGHSNGEVDVYKFYVYDALKLIIILMACGVFILIVGIVIWKKIIQKGSSSNY